MFLAFIPDLQDKVALPCQPQPFDHYQRNGFTLSRPRDFISALSKDRDLSVGSFGEKSQSSTTSGESPSSLQRNPSLNQDQSDSTSTEAYSTSLESTLQITTQAEPEGSSPSSSNSPSASTVALDSRDTESPDVYPITEMSQQRYG